MPITSRRKLLWSQGYPFSAVTSVAATTTWNPSDKHSDFTLSGGNLIATDTVGSGFVSLRAIVSASSGKKYWELAMTTLAGAAVAGVGNATAGLGSYCGVDLNSAGLVNNGAFLLNGGAGSFSAYTATDILCIAADLGAMFIWFRVNGGAWNTGGTDDPSTGLGGANLSSLNAGPYFPMATLNTASDVMTANFGGSAYAQSVPSGYGNW